MPETLPKAELEPNISPYQEAWTQIEQAAASVERLEPQEAYEIYEAHLEANGLDPTIYLSMAITSGGFIRDNSLGIGEVIARNSAYGGMAKQALLHQHPEFTDKDIVLPSELGKVKGWSQAEYLLFWFHVITGLTAEDAAIISEKMAPSLTYPGFTVKDLDTKSKWQDYEQFTHDYIRYLKRLADEKGRRMQPNNMQAVIMILDSDMSLGGRAEELLCRLIGIPPQIQYVDYESVGSVEGMPETAKVLASLGSNALSSRINPPGIKFLGISEGLTDFRLTFGLSMRKTNFMNAILAAEYYRQHPERRPKRHHGHTPIKEGPIS